MMRDLLESVLAEVLARLEPLRNRVRLILGKGELHMVDDGGPVQTVQATFLVGETRDAMERPQDYGFASHPLPGMQPFAGFFGGDRSDGFVIAVCDREYRIRLGRGEVAVYDDLGQKVHLTRAGVVVDSPLDVTVRAGATLRLEGKDVEIHAARSLKWDVDGYGRRITSLGGGAYRDHTWQQGATVSAVSQSIKPPEGP